MSPIAPHLVRPMRFGLPHGPGLRPLWMLRAGLFLYDRLGGARSVPASSPVDLRNGPLAAPLRNTVRDGLVYSDCVVDDARLTIANARDAARHGAQILTRTEMRAARRDGDLWRAALSTADGTEEIAASPEQQGALARYLTRRAAAAGGPAARTAGP